MKSSPLSGETGVVRGIRDGLLRRDSGKEANRSRLRREVQPASYRASSEKARSVLVRGSASEWSLDHRQNIEHHLMSSRLTALSLVAVVATFRCRSATSTAIRKAGLQGPEAD